MPLSISIASSVLLYPYDYDPYVVSHQELSYHICVTVFAYV